MKSIFSQFPALASLLLVSGVSRGGEARVPGGLSPDGKLEVVAIEKKPSVDLPTNHEFVLRETESRKSQFKVSEAGYAQTISAAVDLEYANSAVLWKADSDAFAFNLRDTKRSRSTSVFVSEDGKWRNLKLKKSFPQICKDLGIKEAHRCRFEDPLRWEGRDTLVLKSSGDCVLPNLPREQAFRWFEYEVSCRLLKPGKIAIKQTALRDYSS